jgi:hypothetical protein
MTTPRNERRAAQANRIHKNRALALGAIGVAIVAGSARTLRHDAVHDAHHLAKDRIEKVSDAFTDPNPGVLTGEPSLADAAHQAQVNEAHNAAVAAAKAAENTQPK